MSQEKGIKRILTQTNAVVVQLEERQNPGVVIQGDSLRNLHSLSRELSSHIRTNELDEAREIAEEIAELLSGYLRVLNSTS